MNERPTIVPETASARIARIVELEAARRVSQISGFMAEILVNCGVNLDDSDEVERIIRKYYIVDQNNEIGRLVAMCPEIARNRLAEIAKQKETL